MTPFSVQKLCMEFSNSNIRKIDVIESKFSFCNEFEDEMLLTPSKYSESVYDFFYCIFYYKEKLNKSRWDIIYYDSIHIDFQNTQMVTQYINKIYEEVVLGNLNFFRKLINFKTEGKKQDEQQAEFSDRFQELREKILAY